MSLPRLGKVSGYANSLVPGLKIWLLGIGGQIDEHLVLRGYSKKHCSLIKWEPGFSIVI